MVLAPPDLEELKVYELKAICRARGLKVSGRKAMLVERIREADSGAFPPAASAAQAAQTPAQCQERTTGGLSPIPSRLTANSFAASGPSDYHQRTLALGLESGGVDAEVLDSMDFEVADRRRQRRARLQRYYAEEMDRISAKADQMDPRAVVATEMAGSMYDGSYNSAFAALRSQAGPGYGAAISQDAIDVEIGGSGTSIAYSGGGAAVPLLPAGAPTTRPRYAWCRYFDAAAGVGVLVDLGTQSDFAVQRDALRVLDDGVAEEDRMLYRGEFVEYELAEDAGTHGCLVVQGIQGWPLMFEAALMFDKQRQERMSASSTQIAPGRGRGLSL